MLLLQQDDHARGLGVEGRRDVQQGLGDDLLDLGVRHGTLLAELVDGATALDGLEEWC